MERFIGDSGLEKQEDKEKQHTNRIVTDFFRHGKSDYIEYEQGENEEERDSDLTEDGRNDIETETQRIVDGIDPEKEVVALWSSSANRAWDSAKIIKDKLEEKNIPVSAIRRISSLRPMPQKSILSEAEVEEEFSRGRKRAERVYNWIRYLAERADLEGKTLHIIAVSHYELLNPIMEDIFHFKGEEGDGYKSAESMNIEFCFDKQTKEFSISASFRGEKVDNVIFDTEQRKFFVKAPGLS